jgi:hypothetical protein
VFESSPVFTLKPNFISRENYLILLSILSVLYFACAGCRGGPAVEGGGAAAAASIEVAEKWGGGGGGLGLFGRVESCSGVRTARDEGSEGTAGASSKGRRI